MPDKFTDLCAYLVAFSTCVAMASGQPQEAIASVELRFFFGLCALWWAWLTIVKATNRGGR